MMGKGGTLKLPYEKSIAVIQLGMDQATFSRALAKLEGMGVTLHGGEVTLNDFHVCQNIAAQIALCRSSIALGGV